VNLDALLIAAHSAGDTGALVSLYIQASAEAHSDEAKGFYLTHAYVFALEAGDPRAQDLSDQLKSQGRL
jgi:hypothetical protein